MGFHPPGTDHGQTPKNRGRRAVAALVGVAVAATTVVAGLTGATASLIPNPAYAGPGLILTNFYNSGSDRDSRAGAYHQAAGLEGSANTGLAWCVEAGPPPSMDWAQTSPMPGANSTRMAAVLAKHEATDTAESRGQLAYLVHQYLDAGLVDNGGQNGRQRWLNAFTSEHPAQVTAAEAWWTEAAALEGPFTATPVINLNVSQQAGTVEDVGATGGSGSWLASQPFTLTLTGPAVFDATGTNVITGQTASTPLDYAFTSTGNGDVYASIAVTGLPADHVLSYKPADMQRFLIQAAGTEVSGQSTTHPVMRDFQPEVTTQVAAKFVTKGAPIIDQVTAAASADSSWIIDALAGEYVPVTASGTLYGPFVSQPAQSDAVPAGSPVVGTESLTFNGPETLSSPGTLTATASGYYTWVWSIKKAAQTPAVQPLIRGDFTDAFGRVAETAIVPFQPVVTTERDSIEVAAGEGLVDHVTSSVSAGDMWLTTADGKAVEVTANGTAYGPFIQPLAQGSAIPAGAPIAGTESLVFDSAETLSTSGSVKTTTPGFYTWVWSIKKADQPAEFANYISGDFIDQFMINLETSTVKHQITHSSMAREYNVVPGGRAFDTITISGMPADHTEFAGLGDWFADGATADVTVYGPLAAEPSTTEVPEGAPILTTTTVAAKNGIFNVGYTDADKVVATDAGFYVFVYSFAGDSRVAPFTSPFNDVLERFYVPGDAILPVQVVTQAKPAALVGESIFDTALVTGNVTDGSYLVFEAFGPQDASEVPVCTEAFFTSENIDVGRPGYYQSGVTTVTTTGSVYWVESLYSAEGKLLHQGECGIPAETTVITEIPKDTLVVSTKATPEVELGQPAHDTALVTGDVPEGTILSFEAFLQDGNQAVCTTPIFTTEYGVIDGAGTYGSAETVFTAPGTYFWVETLTGPDGTVLHKGICGAPGETTVVNPVPTPPVTPPAPITPSSGTGGAGGGLAITGAQVTGIAGAAALILALGAGMFTVARRRRGEGNIG